MLFCPSILFRPVESVSVEELFHWTPHQTGDPAHLYRTISYGRISTYLHIYLLTYLHWADLAQVAHVPYWRGSRVSRPRIETQQHWHCHHQLPSWEHDCLWQTEILRTVSVSIFYQQPVYPPTLHSRGRGVIYWFHLRHPVQFEDASGGVMGIIVSTVRITRLLASSYHA